MPSLEERGLNKQALLNKARIVKNDEFYTSLEDYKKRALYISQIYLER